MPLFQLVHNRPNWAVCGVHSPYICQGMVKARRHSGLQRWDRLQRGMGTPHNERCPTGSHMCFFEYQCVCHMSFLAQNMFVMRSNPILLRSRLLHVTPKTSFVKYYFSHIFLLFFSSSVYFLNQKIVIFKFWVCK
jgi:hypothetical protein